MTTLFEALRHDHDKHRDLLDRLEKTSGMSRERHDLLKQLKAELASHAAAEERTLYARMMQSPSATDAARHGVAEHHEIDELIERLEDRSLDDPHWLTTFRKLKAEVEHHMKDEEHGIFQLAGKVLPEHSKQMLATTFENEKERELERLAP